MLKRFLHVLLVAVVGVTLGLVAAPTPASASGPSVYTQPGDHVEGGRYWQTDCQMYSSSIVRCSTDIWATTYVEHEGSFHDHDAWTFNNLTYLPAPRAAWGNNPLANPGTWTGDDGRTWRTECDTATTGGNGCRTYVTAHVVSAENGGHVVRKLEILNNIVQFSTSAIPHQTTVPATAPAVQGMPVDKAFTPPSTPVQSCKASYYASYFNGRRTANGETFNNSAMTAAHRSLAFGTRVKVSNPSTGASVVVRINDRGPFVSGRCLDLSSAAMSAVGGISSGVMTVNYQILD